MIRECRNPNANSRSDLESVIDMESDLNWLRYGGLRNEEELVWWLFNNGTKRNPNT